MDNEKSIIEEIIANIGSTIIQNIVEVAEEDEEEKS